MAKTTTIGPLGSSSTLQHNPEQRFCPTRTFHDRVSGKDENNDDALSSPNAGNIAHLGRYAR